MATQGNIRQSGAAGQALFLPIVAVAYRRQLRQHVLAGTVELGDRGSSGGLGYGVNESFFIHLNGAVFCRYILLHALTLLLGGDLAP